MTLTIESNGRRHYLLGNTYSIKDQLRAAGCKWDPDRKAWWTGKRDVAERLASEVTGTAPAGASSESSSSGSTGAGGQQGGPGEAGIVAGRASYKGRDYYIAGRVQRGRTHWDDRVEAVSTRDGAKLLLLFRDGSSQFWAARSEVQVTKTYDRPATIGKLRRFAEDARAGRVATCNYCGSASCDGARGGHCEED